MSGTGGSSVVRRWAKRVDVIGPAFVAALASVVVGCGQASDYVQVPDVIPIVVPNDPATTFATLRDAPPPMQFGLVGNEALAPDVALATSHELNRRLVWDVNLDGAAVVRISAALSLSAPGETKVDVQTMFPQSRLTQSAALLPGDFALITAASNAALSGHVRAVLEQREPDPFFTMFDRYVDRVAFDDSPHESRKRNAFRERLRKAYSEVTKPTEDRIVARLGPQWFMIGQDHIEVPDSTTSSSRGRDIPDTGLPPTARMRQAVEPTSSADPVVDLGR